MPTPTGEVEEERPSFPERGPYWPRTDYEMVMVDVPVRSPTQTSSVLGAKKPGEWESRKAKTKRLRLEAEKKQWIEQRDAQLLNVYFGSSPTSPTEALERGIPAPQIRSICATKDSAVEWYDPVQLGRTTRLYGNYAGKLPTQPLRPEGKEWPAHVALARLRLPLIRLNRAPDTVEQAKQDIKRVKKETDVMEQAVLRFCGDYGLLGLRKIPLWKNRTPWQAGHEMTPGPDSHSRWYDYLLPSPHWQERLQGVRAWRVRTPCEPLEPFLETAQEYKDKTPCEPLELFLEAAQEYQQVFALLKQLKDAPEKRPEPPEDGSHDTPVTRSEIATDAQQAMRPYLNGCTLTPVFSEGRWPLGCQFRSLLDVCYFRLMLDMTEGAGEIRRCADKKCNRFFLASPHQLYCCQQHRKRAAAAGSADRQVKTWLRKLRKAGSISRDLLDAARAEVDRLYDKGNPDGMKDEVELGKQVLAFLGLHPKSKKGV